MTVSEVGVPLRRKSMNRGLSEMYSHPQINWKGQLFYPVHKFLVRPLIGPRMNEVE